MINSKLSLSFKWFKNETLILLLKKVINIYIIKFIEINMINVNKSNVDKYLQEMLDNDNKRRSNYLKFVDKKMIELFK